MTLRAETFPALEAVSFIRHAFTWRVPGIDVQADRETALARLDASHTQTRERMIGPNARFVTTEQVHGNDVVLIANEAAAGAGAADGMITSLNNVCLGIYVADCGAVYLVDPVRRAIGLLHSGKKGTELGITARAIEQMTKRFGSDPRDLIVQLGPCIRPPHYEMDFAAQILAQARDCGVGEVFDCGANTAAEPERYYSYRMERGRTGRMLAMLALAF